MRKFLLLAFMLFSVQVLVFSNPPPDLKKQLVEVSEQDQTIVKALMILPMELEQSYIIERRTKTHFITSLASNIVEVNFMEENGVNYYLETRKVLQLKEAFSNNGKCLNAFICNLSRFPYMEQQFILNDLSTRIPDGRINEGFINFNRKVVLQISLQSHLRLSHDNLLII